MFRQNKQKRCMARTVDFGMLIKNFDRFIERWLILKNYDEMMEHIKNNNGNKWVIQKYVENPLLI